MPRKCELTWQAGTGSRQGRWKRKYKGRTLYLGSAGSKSDLAAYREAMAVWKTKKAEIDAEEAARPKPHQAEYDQAISEWDQVLRWSLEHGDEANAAVARLKLADLRHRLADRHCPPLTGDDRFWNRFEWPRELLSSITACLPGTAPVVEPADHPNRPSIIDPSRFASEMDGSPSRIQREIWQDRLATQSAPDEILEQTLGASVERYLASDQLRVAAGQLSAGRFTSKRNNLRDFRDWFGRNASITTITGGRLTEYRNQLLTRIAENQLARDTAHGRLNDVVSFIRWLWVTEALEELPRILDQKAQENKLTIGTELTTPQFFTVDEVKECLKAANERTRLFLLLMLNCGMYQGDISNLKHEEVDWKAGTITRKRSKTKKHKKTGSSVFRCSSRGKLPGSGQRSRGCPGR